MARIVFIVNNLNFLMSHRAYLIESFEDNGFEVDVLSIRTNGANKWSMKYCELYKSFFVKSKSNSHLYLISPLVHIVGIIPQVFSSKAVTIVSTGLGYLGTSAPNSLKLFYFLVLRLYSVTGASAIVQNKHDYALFRNKLNFKKVELIPGTYVNKNFENKVLGRFAFKERLDIICVSRLYRDKGIHDIVRLYENYPFLKDQLHIHLYGPRERHNPAAYSDSEWRKILDCPLMTYHGAVENEEVHYLLSSGKYAFGILPSYREGMSRFLIECAVYGVPIITTKAPGCLDFEEMGLAKTYNLENIQDMFDVITSTTQISYNDYLKWSSNCAERANLQFSKSRIYQGYLRMV